jgi:methionyl-tRNA formyltransferase
MASIGVAATGDFGADVFERLALQHEIRFCLTRPDRPSGRGRRVSAPPAKDVAARLGIPVLQPERLDGTTDLPAEAIVTCAYGVIVPSQLLDRHLWLNVHPSLLPRWRGAAPVERAILAGDGETGVSIIKLVEELDAGPIAAQRAFPIGPDDDAGRVYDQAARIAAELLDELLDGLDDPTFTPQAEAGATYAEKLTAADRLLDLSDAPRELVLRVRALSPHIGARATLDGRSVTIWAACEEDGRFVPVEVQPEGGRRMSYDAFRRGLRS